MDLTGPWGWHGVDLGYIRGRLCEMEKRTLSEIFATSAKQNHRLDPDSLSKEARKRLAHLKMDDCAENLWSMRFGGVERLIGVRNGRVIALLWWDPRHQVAPSHKKHT